MIGAAVWLGDADEPDPYCQGYAREPACFNSAAAADPRAADRASQLAAELEVSVRTIYRDVESLSEAGVPIYGDAGPAGGYQLLGGYRTRLTGLTAAEAEALQFGPGCQARRPSSAWARCWATAQLKLDAALPPELRERSARITRAVPPRRARLVPRRRLVAPPRRDRGRGLESAPDRGPLPPLGRADRRDADPGAARHRAQGAANGSRSPAATGALRTYRISQVLEPDPAGRGVRAAGGVQPAGVLGLRTSWRGPRGVCSRARPRSGCRRTAASGARDLLSQAVTAGGRRDSAVPEPGTAGSRRWCRSSRWRTRSPRSSA